MEEEKYRILMVEDDRLDQMAFKRLVKQQNLPYDYVIAGSVAQARQILAQEEFQIVFVDYLLGDGTAFDILEAIVDTPTVFATGTGSEELAVKAMKAGASDYLIKDPARNYLKVLPEVFKNAIRHKKAEDELKRYHENLVELVRERTEQLEEEKELLAVTLSSMGDAVVAVDAENKIIIFNMTAETLTGWKCDQVTGKPVEDFFHMIDEQSGQLVDSPIDKVIKSRQIEHGGEYDALVSRNGKQCPISATAAPIRRNDASMTGIVMVFRDVSQKREIDRMKSDFISSVSHELRTPLTSIKACTETILYDKDMPEATKDEFLQIIDEDCDRLTRLINGILEISRMESGTIEIAREPVDVAAVIRRTVTELQSLADKNRVRLEMECPQTLPRLTGDESRIQSVISNLVNNAIKFTPENGQVCLNAREHDGQLIITVSDTGMGIPSEDLPRVFGRFYRVHRPGKQIQGTGLGLAIVKEIVVMHNGRIEVESEVQQGTTFTVYLPLTTQQEPSASKPQTANAS